MFSPSFKIQSNLSGSNVPPNFQDTVELQWLECSAHLSRHSRISMARTFSPSFKTQSNFSSSNLQPVFQDTVERQWLERSAHFQIKSNFNSSKVQRHEHSTHLSSYSQTSIARTFSPIFKLQSNLNGSNVQPIFRVELQWLERSAHLSR